VRSAAIQLHAPAAPAGLGHAAQARRESPTAQAVRRAQAVYLDEVNDALLDELDRADRRSQVLLVVVESLCHALRAWVAYGHSPAAIAGYYQGGELGMEHARAAELVGELCNEFESQVSVPENET
jgi:hypothetical protein